MTPSTKPESNGQGPGSSPGHAWLKRKTAIRLMGIAGRLVGEGAEAARAVYLEHPDLEEYGADELGAAIRRAMFAPLNIGAGGQGSNPLAILSWLTMDVLALMVELAESEDADDRLMAMKVSRSVASSALAYALAVGRAVHDPSMLVRAAAREATGDVGAATFANWAYSFAEPGRNA